MSEFHYCTIWLYKEDDSIYVESFNHGNKFDDMMNDLHQEQWGGYFSESKNSRGVTVKRCLLQGLKIHTGKGYIEKVYNDAMLLELLEEYEKCLD